MEYLAYTAFAIDEDTTSPVPAYISAYGKNPVIHVKQQGNYLKKGALNDYNLSFAANYKHRFLIGVSLGAKRIKYSENNGFIEKDVSGSPKKDIDEIMLDQYLKTTGYGFNAKLGVNYTLNEYVRIGYAYHSPTTFNLTDSYSYTITSKFDFGAVDPYGNTRIDKVVSTDASIFKYKLSVPGRNVFSVGLVNKTLGFISLDIETVNYTQGNLFTANENFTKENLYVKRNLNSNAVNFRLGGEYIQDQYRIRAGYARYPSQYKKGAVPFTGDLVNNIYTAGFGIKNPQYSFDIAYTNSRYADYSVPYTLESGTSYAITNNVRVHNIILSVGIVLDYTPVLFFLPFKAL